MHSLTCSRVCTLHPSWADFYIGSLLLLYIARSSEKRPQMKRLSWRTNSLVNWWNKVFLFCHDLLYFKLLVQTIDKGCCSPFQGFATAPFLFAWLSTACNVAASGSFFGKTVFHTWNIISYMIYYFTQWYHQHRFYLWEKSESYIVPDAILLG